MQDPTNDFGYVTSEVPPTKAQVVLDDIGTTIDVDVDLKQRRQDLIDDAVVVYHETRPPEPVEDDTLPEGAELVLDTPDDLKPTNKSVSPQQILQIISNLVRSEQITTAQAKQMRAKFNIHQSYFTSNRTVDSVKKTKAKKLADANRRRNRRNGSTKGQKRNNGTFG